MNLVGKISVRLGVGMKCEKVKGSPNNNYNDAKHMVLLKPQKLEGFFIFPPRTSVLDSACTLSGEILNVMKKRSREIAATKSSPSLKWQQ